MTVGQRIAQKRKELGLSQEALGERLGVSRQTVYKWESDAALPEIEKLVNLSREFSVSIDWLLGQEDENREPQELTAEQLRMVEEIVGRYLAARPRPEPVAQEIDPEAESETGPAGVRWLKRWGLAWAGLAALVAIVMVFFNLFDRLGSVRQDYQTLQYSVSSIREDVNRQINGITQRVEEVLQSQNALTAEQSAQVVATDYRANTITVSARALPRTYVEGMTAEFILASDVEAVTVPGALGDDHAFTAEITGPLSDDITVSVALVTGEQRETQVIDRFEGLYTRSLVMVDITTNVCGESSAGVWYAAPAAEVVVYNIDNGDPAADEVELKLGLFREQELVAWYTPAENPNPDDDHWRQFNLEVEGGVPLELGVPYCLAALVTDQYGRAYLCPGQVMKCGERVAQSVHVTYSTDPADWEY